MTREAALAGIGTRRARGLAATSVGLGCTLAWTYIVFFSRLVHYSTRNDITHLNSTYALACCGIVATLFACAVSVGLCSKEALRSAGSGPCRMRQILRLAEPAGALLCAATVVLAMVERELFTQPWCSIASALAGCGTALLLLAWAWDLSLLRSTSQTIVCLTSSFVLGAALFVVAQYLPAPVGVTLCAVLPLFSAALFHAARQRATRGARPNRGDADAPAPHCSDPDAVSWGAIVRTFVCIGILGLAESFMRALFLNVAPASDSVAYRWLFFTATLLSCVLLAVPAFGRPKPVAVRLTCRTSMCALVILTLLTPIVAGMGLAADITTLICHCVFNLLAWSYLALTARAYPVATVELFGLGLGASYLGCLLGTFSGGVVSSFCNPGYRVLSLVALLCAGAVLASLLFIADEQVFARLVDADEERPQAPRRFMLRIRQVARDRGLTPKETEVFTLAAKGRTTQRICDELGISVGTANTHLAHVYKKLGVHDRQQMLDLLEGRPMPKELEG